MNLGNAPFRIGQWRVNPALDEICRDGITTKLEPRTMCVLICLAEHEGEVVSVNQLLDRVWTGVVVTQFSVYRAIAILRRALEDDPRDPTYIASVPRRGYRLVAPIEADTKRQAAPQPAESPAETQFPEEQAPVKDELQPVPSATPDAGEVAKHRITVRYGLIVIALLVLAGGLWWFLLYSGRSVATRSESAAIREKSIAVLPFVDLSEKKDQEYFANGMAEEILDILAKTPQLTVIGRISSFQFRNHTEDVRTIGEKLTSAYVVEGSVRKAGERVRVSAQLLDTHSGTQIWSESYDRDFGDVLKLQDDIATSIARALQLTVGAHDARPLRSAQAAEAYTLYLKGRLALDKFQANSLLEAQNSFHQALALDSTLLPAAEGLALTYITRGEKEEDISGREAWEHAKSVAQKVLQTDINSSTAHGVLGFVAGMLDYDWPIAEKELRKAIALNPNDARMLIYAADILAMRGNYEEAVQRAYAAVVLDPLNANLHPVLGFILYRTGDFPAAESALRKALALDPEIGDSHLILGYIQLVRGNQEAALKEFGADADPTVRDVGLALVSHALGKKAESDAALARAVEQAGNIWPYGIALIYAYRGERDQAFEWLEKAYAFRDVDLVSVLGDPLLLPLHDDPRWSALMKKMNLAN